MSKRLWSDHKNMKSLIEGWRGFVNEEEPPAEAEQSSPEEGPEQTSGGSWPGKPPKSVRISADSGLSPEVILGVWKKMSSMNPPKNPEEQMANIGGPEELVKRVKQLENFFSKSGDAPPRIKMPVVDPKKDIEDLRGRLAKGKLDVKPPFADWEDVESDALTKSGKRGVSRKGREGRLAFDPNSRAKKPKRSISSQGRMREGEEEFPTDLVDDHDPVQDAYLTKGLRDGDKKDDSAVQLVDDVKIAVSKSFPTQSEVYLDKIIWNILNFGGTPEGETAHGKPNLIAIQDGGNNFILDGHHRWGGAFVSGGPGASIRVQALKGLDVPTAIEALRSYGNARDNEQKS
jgi:hypothetical protein